MLGFGDDEVEQRQKKTRQNRDRVRRATNVKLQRAALEDADWRAVREPIVRQIRTIASEVCDDAGLRPIKIGSDVMEALIHLIQQFITEEASNVQELVEHHKHRTATEADVNAARGAFLMREGYIAAPAFRHVAHRYVNHSYSSRVKIGANSRTTRQKFVILGQLDPDEI